MLKFLYYLDVMERWPAPKAHPPRAGSWQILMYYVYILYSKRLGKFYIGYTEDLKNRIKLHNSGLSPFTSTGHPWILAYYEAFTEKSDAEREEKFLKTGKGRGRRKILLKSFLEKINNGEVAELA